GFLTVWPAGLAQPVVSTLNAMQGQVIANAAIIPAGTAGAISVFASDDTDVIADINPYFGPVNGGGLRFYPLPPCRFADTRSQLFKVNGMNVNGPPIVGAQSVRGFITRVDGCGAPDTAAAVSVNVTAVPQGYLGYITLFSGLPLPLASTLNAWQ